jgi:hypothetical protein
MQATNLSTLMKFLHISSTELADGIHVHPSLISRWRSGNRRLKTNTDHFDRLINYIISRDVLTEHKNIEVFLSQFDPEVHVGSADEAKMLLKNYLVRQDIIQQKYLGAVMPMPESDSFMVYQGAKEKRDALISFMDMALTIPPGANIGIMISHDIDHYLDDATYYKKWSNKLQQLIEHGHSLCFIYNYTYMHLINNIKNFFWLYAHENITGYTNPDFKRSSHTGNMFIIRDKFAMTDFITDPESRNLPIFSFTNPLVIQQLDKLFLSVQNVCHPITSNLLYRRPKDMTMFIKKRISADNPLYIYDYYPFCFPIEHHLFREILSDNDFTESEIVTALRLYNDILCKPLLSPHYKFPKRFILNGEELSTLSKKEAYLFPTNLLSEKKILIKRRHFRHFFVEMLSHIKLPPDRKCIEIAIVESQLTDIETGFLSITKEHLFTFVFPYFFDSSERRSMLFSNIELLADAWEFYDDLWYRLPNESKNESNIIAQIENILETL